MGIFDVFKNKGKEEQEGECVAISKWYINSEECDAFRFEFNNLKVPDELDKYLYKGWFFIRKMRQAKRMQKQSNSTWSWVFAKDEHTEVIIEKYSYLECDLNVINKLFKATVDDEIEIIDHEFALIRLQDFDLKKFLNDNFILNPNGINEILHENGIVHKKFEINNGVINGLYREFHQNGNIIYEINYKEGLKYGPFKDFFYDTPNLVAREGNYKNDKLDGLINFYAKNNKVRMVMQFNEGNRLSQEKFFEVSSDFKPI